MSYESQRYFGNFIKKNDLPLPFAYYIWNKEKKILEYKINFQILAEVMCLTNSRYILQIGSESAIGMGKTSMLQFIYPDKRAEALNTDGSSTLRNGSIDVLFPSDASYQKKESYLIFDIHGTVNTFNEDIITAIQENCALQIFYVTERDLETNFLTSMINYSEETKAKSTFVIIFDPEYDNIRNRGNILIDMFKSKYSEWKYVTWITAPCAQLWYQRDSNKKNKDLARSQRLLNAFTNIMKNLDKKNTQNINCSCIFSIQAYYLLIKNSTNYKPPVNHRFKIRDRLEQLFNGLNDKTENLRLVTPVTYLTSAIKRCERELSDNWDSSPKEIQTERNDLIQELNKITKMNKYTKFFIDLLTKYSFIDILITEKYLENWRFQFQPVLHDQSMEVKAEAQKLYSTIKQLEERLLSTKEPCEKEEMQTIQKKLDDVRNRFQEKQNTIMEIDKKLTNIDLTIGLFCDEIMALYEHASTIFNDDNLVENIAKKFANLILKGFAIHILRGRPLYCKSKLIQKVIKYIQRNNDPPLVLTVIGEQSSAKSSLMNATFGCNFRVSAGRCTIGMYMSIIQWRSKIVIVFDTEGLLSLEEAGSIFDNQMITMAVLSSHLVLINHKGEFSSNLKDLIGISFYAKIHIQTPIKPKLLFVLRDQVEFQSKKVFFRQLTQFKEQLQNDSKFFKTSVDEELDINVENVCLLPNAFSHDVHQVSNINQCWRNQSFSIEITKLRNTIFQNITNTTITTKPNPIFRTQALETDPVYSDMTHFYERISGNWETIDRLGPKLLNCRTLYELCIMEELQNIAIKIVQTTNFEVIENGEKLINDTLSSMSKQNFIDKDRDQIVETFNRQLMFDISKLIDKAQASFNRKTERSCFLPNMKLKVSKSMEPPIRSAQHLLKEMFEDRLIYEIRQASVNNAKHQLMTYAQNEFDNSKGLNFTNLEKWLQQTFESVLKQNQENLRASFETEVDITPKVLKMYNSQLNCMPRSTTRENIYSWLHLIPYHEWSHNKEWLDGIKECMPKAERHIDQQKETKPTGLWSQIKSIVWTYKPASNQASKQTIYVSKTLLYEKENIDKLWLELKDTVKWFDYGRETTEMKKTFVEIWNSLLPNFKKELHTLIKNSKSLSSDFKTIEHLFQLIENTMNSDSIQNSKYLQKHMFCADLAKMGLNIIIEQAVFMEKTNYDVALEKMLKEITECKENLLNQCKNMKDSFELGKVLGDMIGRKIIDQVSDVLKRKINSDLIKDIAQHQFINHDAIQKRAYEYSICQANGENIVKYVDDINRYFIELSLEEIKTTLNVLVHKHSLKLENLIMKTIDTVNDLVQQGNHKDTGSLGNDIHKKILSIPELQLNVLYKGSSVFFSMEDIMNTSISDSDKFKKGFLAIRDYYNDIQKRVEDLIKNMKMEAFSSCKNMIRQKLGCQARCPGCGAKCSKTEPHENEEVEVWQDPCVKCEENKCNCEKPKPISIVTHEASYHLAEAFYGGRYYKEHTPTLTLCYQNWKTSGKYKWKRNQPTNSTSIDDNDDDWELVSPLPKYYNLYHHEWYNNLNKLSIEGNACNESIPPQEQRRAWMVVRPVLLKRYKEGMVDHKKYDEKLYPLNIDSLREDFEPKWNDEGFE